tara:strand:+ start:94 stop:969 length:876 start_codon:yes stop_codon:yes gene_type:complete
MDISQNKTKDIEIIFPKIKLRRSDFAWSVHSSKIPGFTFIYEKLVKAVKEFTEDTELIKCFHKHQTDNIKLHYEKQKELPDEKFYQEYEKITCMGRWFVEAPGEQVCSKPYNVISVSSNDSHKPITFLDNFTIKAKKEELTSHITTPNYDVQFNYGYIQGKGAMLSLCNHPIKSWLGNIYKSIYGNIKFTQVRGLFWYPKNGFREWHTNKYHKQGWRIYLIYADEDEKSWFSFKHPKTGKLRTIADKTGYLNIFKITKNPPIWHNVYSQCNRISLGIHVTDEFIDKFIEFI